MLDRPRVLVAHALTSYAESLACILAEVRPSLDVRLITAANLDAAIASDAGAVVITDRLTPAVETHADGWLLYYPDRENVAVVGGRGSARLIQAPSFPDVLASIDALVARRGPVPLAPEAPADTDYSHR